MADSAAGAASITEYNIRVPKNQKKKYQVMRYNSSLNIDFQKWSQVKMERENNERQNTRGFEQEEQPKFGAGSEFGRDAREEARRKKFGVPASRRYKPEDQPWLLKAKSGGKTYGYRGVREGGISENAAYYVFTHAPDGGIDAYPLHEWYNFQPVHRYKALSAEEAEEEFSRRNKLMNYFSVMTRNRCRGGDEDAEVDDPEEAKLKKAGAKKKELKISDMDDWMDSSDGEDESGSDNDNEKEKEEKNDEKDKKKKLKEKEKNKSKKKKKRDPDDEAFEESDDGDEEGREMDYVSDSSDSESDHEGKANKELKGVSEEVALRRLLSSGSEDDEDEDKEKEKESEQEEEKKEGDKEGGKDDKEGKKKKKKKKKKKDEKKKVVKKEETKRASTSEFSSDSDTDSEVEAKRKAKKEKEVATKEVKEVKEVKEIKEIKDIKESASGGSSRSATPTKEVSDQQGTKRKMDSPPDAANLSGKARRLDNFASAPFAPSTVVSSESGITEDAVRRYLMRKPMTTTELLQKFKSKKTGLNSEQLVNVMTQILKRINPVKQTIKGKMYLSIKR